MPINPVTIEITMAAAKLRATLKANAAGNTISADTSSTPTIGIAEATVIPVSIAKANDKPFTCTPPMEAVSSSNVKLYNGLRKTKKGQSNQTYRCHHPQLDITHRDDGTKQIRTEGFGQIHFQTH